jgi:hypothetical protein
VQIKNPLDLRFINLFLLMKNILILILLGISALSCQNKHQNSNIIPRKWFVAILTDIHLADGYYGNHAQLSRLHNDTVNFYNSIYKNYGYTKAQFDTTLKYYAIHSDKFDELYEEVVTRLNKMDQENLQMHPMFTDTVKNIWSGKNSWELPKDGPQKKIPVNLKLKGKGRYAITFTCRVYPDDESVNPRTSLYFWHENKKKKGVCDSLKSSSYEKDGRLQIISIIKELNDSNVTYLKGFLLNHKDKSGSWKKHVLINGLKVNYIPKK